jgi:hypothetical protein
MEIRKWRYVKGRYRRFETLFLGRIKAVRDGHMTVYRSIRIVRRTLLCG